MKQFNSITEENISKMLFATSAFIMFIISFTGLLLGLCLYPLLSTGQKTLPELSTNISSSIFQLIIWVWYYLFFIRPGRKVIKNIESEFNKTEPNNN